KSHTYDDNTGGGYTVTVKVTDKDGGFDSKTFNVDVHNVAPTATFTSDGPVIEGCDFRFFLSTPSDPSGAGTTASFQYAFDCGKGDSDNFDTSTQGSLGSKNHAYADNGSYTVQVTVTDKDSGSGSASFTASVANVAPSLSGQCDQSSDDGSSHSFSLGSFSD